MIDFKVCVNCFCPTLLRTPANSFQGKTKRRAWQAKVDEGLTREAAQKEYVELIEKLKVSNDYDPNKVPEKVGA